MKKSKRFRLNNGAKLILTGTFIASVFSGCYKAPEMTLEEIEAARAAGFSEMLEKTVSRPKGNAEFVAGKAGGSWYTSIGGDPKSFNMLIAETDSETSSVIAPLTESLASYDINERKWKAQAADFKITTFEESGKLDITYTLRNDLYWDFYDDKDGSRRVKITSDDVIFWYNEICGDEECGSSAYNGQFMQNQAGEWEHIDIEKIDERSFTFHFPNLVAEPVLATNMDFGPAFIYRPAKEKGGADGVKKILTVATDPRELPSCGPYFLTEYTPGQRLLYKRNPHYWDKDANGENHYYPEERIAQIIGNNSTAYLLFTQGKLEAYGPSPEELDEVVENARNAFEADGTPLAHQSKKGYTVFNSDGGMNASFWSFNQNPKNKDQAFYKWFTDKHFRQAMSCLLNRERIIQQTYRGLGAPKLSFFPEANKYYDENIKLQYLFDHEHARSLLALSGFTKGEDGFLYDSDGIKVSFDLTISGGSSQYSDIAQIITDECKKEGITVTVRPTDFQKLVEQLTATYDWQSVLIGLGGGSIFPTQGSNVWVSDGNLHLWYPLQKSPATEWEARVDELYHKAACITEYEKAKPYWDEYQQIFLEQCPIIYLTRGRSFMALQNRWSMDNVYYDNMNGATTEYIYLAQ
ncbi:MAG: ABC transporter substrate-binding protein [Treponema sp.]|nr:ABC transporter substrate-binding protein [Treponema sp.]